MSSKFFRLGAGRFGIGAKFTGRKSRNFSDNSNYMKRFWLPSVLAIASFVQTTKLSDDGLKKSDGTLRAAPIEAQRFKNPLADFNPMLPGTPKTVLVVDGGGLRGCMSIQILKKLESEIQKRDPDLHLWEMFDYILGTSTGGLIAIGLGKMHMSCQEIDNFYDKVANRVFKKGFGNTYSTVRAIKQGVKAIISSSSSVFDTKELELVMKELVHDMDMCDDNDPNNKDIKCAVLTTMANSAHTATPVLLRSFVPQKEFEFVPKEWSKDRIKVETSTKVPDTGYTEFSPAYGFFLPGVSDLKVWEAARATSAAPTYFEALDLPMPPHLAKSVILRKLLWLSGVFSDETTDQYPFWSTTTSDKFVPPFLSGLTKHKTALEDIINQIYDLIIDKKNSKNEKKYSKKQVDEILTQSVEKFNDELEESKKKIKTVVPLKLNVLKKEIYNFDYRLHLQDGGLSGNSPLIDGFVECSRMWPESDIVMLSVGTGMTSPLDVYDHKHAPLASSLFESVFGAKEVSGLMQMISYSARYSTQLTLQRLNPQIDTDKTDMANAKLMNYWRKQGTAFATNENDALKQWAEFLVKNYHSKANKDLK